LVDLFYDDDAYAYARVDAKEKVIIVINRAGAEKSISFLMANLGVKDGSGLASVYGGRKGAVITNKSATLTVPAKTAAAYLVR
jgi:hypothetical protein